MKKKRVVVVKCFMLRLISAQIHVCTISRFWDGVCEN